MDWKQHLFIGFFVGIFLCFVFSFDIFSVLPLIFLSAFSAILPDIDHKDSKIRQLTNYAAFLFSFLFSLLSLEKIFFDFSVFTKLFLHTFAIFGFYSFLMIFLMPRHRGFVHSLFFAGVYAILLLFLAGGYFALFGVVGFLSHLIADREVKLF